MKHIEKYTQHIIFQLQKIYWWKKFLWSVNEKHFKTYYNKRKIATGQGDDYTTGCLLDYNYFKEYYKLIAMDLSKQRKLDADSKEIQQISFTGNLEQNATMIFIIKETKETILEFSKGTVRVLILFCFNKILI